MLYCLAYVCYISLFISNESILVLIENKHNFHSFQYILFNTFIQHNLFNTGQHFIQSPTKVSIF